MRFRTDRPTDRSDALLMHKLTALTTFFHRAIHSLLESDALIIMQLGEQQKKFLERLYITNSIRTDGQTDRQERCVDNKLTALTTFFHRAIHSLLESDALIIMQLGEQQKNFLNGYISQTASGQTDRPTDRSDALLTN